MRSLGRSLVLKQTLALLAGLVLIAGVGFMAKPAARAADGAPWPAGVVYSTDLIASQHTDVGTVNIKYDATSVFVQVLVDSGWCATDVKIAAGPLSAYTNNGGNPVPGKFPLKKSYSPCTNDTGWLSLDKPEGWDYTVAVHATVAHLAAAVTHTIASAVGDTIYGPASTPAGLAGLTAQSAVPVPTNPAWVSVPGGAWISTAELGVDPTTGYVLDTYRKVVKTLSTSGYLFDVSPLTANSDNAEQVFVNGVSQGSDGQMALGPVTDDQKYKTLIDYPLPLVNGPNTISILFRNYGVPNLDPPYTAALNPTAVAFHATYKVAPTDTAWASGTAWGGANWAMFVELPAAVTSVEVSATDMGGTDVTLGNGTYLVYVTGTWTNRNGADLVDASCTSESGGVWAASAAGYPDDLLELQIDQTDINWGPSCDPGHVYMTDRTVTTGTMNLRIYDGIGNNQIPSWFADNAGHLDVTLYKIS